MNPSSRSRKPDCKRLPVFHTRLYRKHLNIHRLADVNINHIRKQIQTYSNGFCFRFFYDFLSLKIRETVLQTGSILTH